MQIECKDEQIVKEVLNGQKDKFRQLVEKYYRRLASWVFEIISDSVSAEDIVQESFLRAFRNLSECRNPASFYAWLFGIARNCAMEWLRENKKEPVSNYSDLTEHLVFEQEETSPSGYEEKESVVIGNALKSLPENAQTILILKYWRGNSCEEISMLLKMPIGTVRSILSRSYEKLREILG